jgi:hypothetical protein
MYAYPIETQISVGFVNTKLWGRCINLAQHLLLFFHKLNLLFFFVLFPSCPLLLRILLLFTFPLSPLFFFSLTILLFFRLPLLILSSFSLRTLNTLPPPYAFLPSLLCIFPSLAFYFPSTSCSTSHFPPQCPGKHNWTLKAPKGFLI